MEKKTWIIHGREGYCGDFGCCEPDAAGEAIRRRQAKGELDSQEPCFSCINTEDLHRANYGDHTYTHYEKEVFENEEHE